MTSKVENATLMNSRHLMGVR